MYDGTWYHKFGSTWHMATEMYAMYQRDVPSVSGSITPEKGTNGANCRPGLQTCLAPEWAMVNYINSSFHRTTLHPSAVTSSTTKRASAPDMRPSTVKAP
jgi:hypothetical protein